MRRTLGSWVVMCALVGCAPVSFNGRTAIKGSPMQLEQAPEPEPVAKPAPMPEVAVDLTAALSQQKIPAEDASTFVARVRIDPQALEGVAKPAVSVALVLDASGSMVGEPLEKAKEAALEFVEALGDDDRVSLVVFHSITETLVPLRPLADGGRKEVREALEGLQATGTTDLAGGLAAGFAQVRQSASQGGAARVVLLSDGQPNDATPILPNVQRAAQQGITVSALGLGLEYDEELLGQIAQRSGGTFHFAESPDQVAAVFRDEVLALQRITGRNASLVLRPGPGINIRSVLGPAQRVASGQAVVQIGDLMEGRERDVFVLLETEAHREGASVEALDATLTFYDPFAKQSRIERAFVGARASSSDDAIEASRDRDVELATARALAAHDSLTAMTLARSGDLRGAKKRMTVAINRAKRDAKRFDDDVLREKVEELAELKSSLPSLVPPRPARPRMAVGAGGTGIGRPSARPRMEPPVGGAGTKRSHAASMSQLGF